MDTPEAEKPQSLPPGIIPVIIQYDVATGNVQVQGPLDNMVMCLGILEAAKTAVVDHNKSKKISPLMLPAHLRGPFGRQGNGGADKV